VKLVATLVTDFSRLPKDDRNQHVQVCVRREIASKGHFLQSDVHYCHLCFDWVVGQEAWDSHCQTHLQKLPSKQCGTITYCHTLVRPGYCPFCLGGDVSKLAGQRLGSWCREHSLWAHIGSHLVGQHWPLRCPHPQCDNHLSDEKEMQFHLIDEHGLGRTRFKQLEASARSSPGLSDQPRSKKRLIDEGELSWMLPEDFSSSHPVKKRRRSSSTMPPSLRSQPGDLVTPLLLHHDVAPPRCCSTISCACYGVGAALGQRRKLRGSIQP
jgi:hypothetical protein